MKHVEQDFSLHFHIDWLTRTEGVTNRLNCFSFKILALKTTVTVFYYAEQI